MIQHFSVLLTVAQPTATEDEHAIEPSDLAKAIEHRLGHWWHETTVTVDEVTEDKPTVLRAHDLAPGAARRRGYPIPVDDATRAREAAEDRIDAQAKAPSDSAQTDWSESRPRR